MTRQLADVHSKSERKSQKTDLGFPHSEITTKRKKAPNEIFGAFLLITLISKRV
tara:strand:- start:505 stop:666 length:162 start_codon:yes stop_codon:yes gene_type:complete